MRESLLLILSLGSYDFLGLNHYTTGECLIYNSNKSKIHFLCNWESHLELVKDQKGATPGWYQDQDTFTYQDPNWEGSGSPWLKVVPCNKNLSHPVFSLTETINPFRILNNIQHLYF